MKIKKGWKKSILTGWFVLGISLFLFSQFLPQEIADRPDCEDFLRKANIIKSEPIGEGVTKPYKLFLQQGDRIQCGCWKNPEGIQKGYLEGWNYEIAAYEMDKLLGIHMVPPTVEKEFEGQKGSLQFWVETKYSLLDIMEASIEIPQEHLTHINKMKYITRAFDSLIANEDRTQQNILITEDWRMILIDHSRAFRSSEEFTELLMFGRNGIRGTKMIRALPRLLVKKIVNLDEAAVRGAVGPHLNDEEIQAVLKRKILLLDEIKAMVKMYGEERFYY
jgi:hypothetical protein